MMTVTSQPNRSGYGLQTAPDTPQTGILQAKPKLSASQTRLITCANHGNNVMCFIKFRQSMT